MGEERFHQLLRSSIAVRHVAVTAAVVSLAGSVVVSTIQALF